MPATFPGFPINRRAQVALELYTTERSYVRRLETVLQVRGELLCCISYQLLEIQNFIQLNLDYPDLLGPHEIVWIIEDPDIQKYKY